MVERRRKNIFIPIVAEFCNIHIRASESGNIHRSSRLDIRICFVGNIIVFVSSFRPSFRFSVIGTFRPYLAGVGIVYTTPLYAHTAHGMWRLLL